MPPQDLLRHHLLMLIPVVVVEEVELPRLMVEGALRKEVALKEEAVLLVVQGELEELQEGHLQEVQVEQGVQQGVEEEQGGLVGI